ncbi:dehydrodolichyl diphosphate synthase complex subunit NUS1-like [Pistacia vera]|uniref:dehydrodolichyl diphosphate synthase complex subunit NUS1-like n=1 Tax=Pistacia vera TaxID=55513 RepID=UPI00126342F1|nr:dehydrodolichyl diphosphate synthase complex subunit NUS1-like [Pistacia vera]XP_031267064.1 dehydrodolichyl diphosphate synthase complex subunit NUS1-like [Pistacia vera]XP_031267066.1 dehydrodolichyl diphosphate synthase complex subunit NUS1-like [Pistacia vera]
MDFRDGMHKVYSFIAQIGNLGLHVLWYFLHFIVSLWYFALGVICALESYLISIGILKRYEALDINKLRYLVVVVESEEAYQIPKIIELLQWLVALGVKRVCLYDTEGILKKSKDSILVKLNNATVFEEADQSNPLLDHKHISVEFASFSDGKEAVAKAANLLFRRYLKLGDSDKIQEEKIFTEARMTEALTAVGCRGPEPDLLLVYGPARCHLGFPAWRIRYTEIIHMGSLNSMKYGSLIKAIYRFTMVEQKYGK